MRYFILLISASLILGGCILNNPHPNSPQGKNIYYGTFDEEPKHLDPAQSYSSDEYRFICQIYEPPLQYHYLKRPYKLIPLTAQSIPTPQYFDADGNSLPRDAPAEQVARAVYEIQIQPGILYQEHPCFAKDKMGNFLYHNLNSDEMRDIYQIRDFKHTGTRELVAADYVYQIKRLADPRLHCPILSTLEKYILGLEEYATALDNDLEAERKRRRESAGAAYNQELDEQRNPIPLDLDAHPSPLIKGVGGCGVELVNRYTYRIILKEKYPQILYWLAMPFFSPMPKEAITFYEQGPLKNRNITIDRFPVGTGAYRLDVIDPHKEIVLKRNEHFHTELYPSSDSESEDGKLGLLSDMFGSLTNAKGLWGKRLPFIDTAVYKLEKEFIPRWNKFLQGYYDVSGISSDTFDRAIQFTDQGDPQVSEVLTARNIRLLTNVETSTHYLAFNMLDDVVGGYTEEKRKLRQAISIAMDYEEYIEIFANGRGIPSYSPIPSGIFGYEEGEKGINPYVYDFSTERGAMRKSLDEARRLLAEAGYPGGKDKNGNPLIIHFDNAWVEAGATAQLSWMRKKLEAIGITMVSRTTDYNRFQDKVHSGNFQILSWGWLADYPDPENFLFLLYGPNSMAESDGENVANYQNPQYDRLFEQMRSMENSSQRLAIIREMKQILQMDAPWVFTYHPVDFGLYHQWVRNAKPSNMANNTLKYLSVDGTLREDNRQGWNRPVLWPIAIVLALLFVFTIPATITIWRRERGRGKGAKWQDGKTARRQGGKTVRW